MAESLSIVKAALAAAAPVVALVADRISPRPLVQGEPIPAIVIRRISTLPATHLRGDGHMDQVRVQIDCHAATETEVIDLAAKARAALESAATPFTDEIDDFDDFSRTHVKTQDYLVFLDPTA